MCINRIWKCLYSQQSKFKLLNTSASDRWFDWTDNSHTPKLQRTYQLAELKMYHLRVLTLSFTKRKWHIYECSVRRFPPSGGLGRGWRNWLGRGYRPEVDFPYPSPQLFVISRVTQFGEVFLFVATLRM